MSRPAHVVGPWDLHRGLAVFPSDPAEGSIVLVESLAKGAALPWHRKKLVLVLSAQRHLAAALRAEGFDVDLRRAPSYVEGIRAHVLERGSSAVVAMEPREWALDRRLREADLGAPLRLLPDGGPGGHFLLTRDACRRWLEANGPPWRQDAFYRWIRSGGGWLMDKDGRPVGGRWSFDTDNRKPTKGARPPRPPSHPPDGITREVMARVERTSGLWGSVEGFDWPVTRDAALAELRSFVDTRLPRFGDHQDAMVDGEPFLWHARLSTSMNLGLLDPREVVAAVVGAWEEGRVPLNAAEGMLRQVVGWREFMRAVYWHRMPELRHANLLKAHAPLPDFYWDSARTDLRCVQQAVSAVEQHGYAHHIQRLMVLGNLAMLLGVRPLEISHWFWAAFVDAYEWVELPNVVGMAVYADDAFTTKPYAASGNYIRKMGDHCAKCAYDVKVRHGPRACPFNPLFWSFMVRHRERLTNNVRLRRLYATWDRKPEEERAAILRSAQAFQGSLRPSDHGWSFDDDAG